MRNIIMSPARIGRNLLRNPWYDQAPFWCLVTVILAAFIPWLFGGRSQNHLFREGALMTDVSVLLLVASGFVSALVFLDRQNAAADERGCARFIWLLITLGFFFLALDEHFEIHEKGFEPLILRALGLQPNAFTDRIDDLIVGAYGVAGLALLVVSRRELLHFRKAWPMLLGGFLMGVLMVAFDMLTNDNSVLERAHLTGRTLKQLCRWCEVCEDGSKIVAEGFFLSAFCRAKVLARGMRQ